MTREDVVILAAIMFRYANQDSNNQSPEYMNGSALDAAERFANLCEQRGLLPPKPPHVFNLDDG